MPFKVKKIRKRPHYKAKPTTQKPKKPMAWYQVAMIAAITLGLMGLVHNAERAGVWFKASVLQPPLPFDGTVMPVEKVPNWMTWGGDANTRYSEVPASKLIDLPPYDLVAMQTPFEDLVWGDPDDDRIRNIQITYAVPYLGRYDLTHHEEVGSHLAVDIKVPLETPLRSIANGRVTKVSNTSAGFGHHIVIEHPGVPDPDNPGHTTTLHSSYSHMGQLSVVEGQTVVKGEIIGYSGSTGTSTTPHVHFQVDTDEAPWHPYWPFTSSEASAAGYNFFEAINAGLNIDRAREYSVHPIQFVMDNRSYQGDGVIVVDNDPVQPEPTPEPEPAPEPDEIPDQVRNDNQDDDSVGTPVELPEPVILAEDPDAKAELFDFVMTSQEVAMVNNGIPITVVDKDNQLAELSNDAEIDVELTGVGHLVKRSFLKTDFNQGTIKVVVKSDEPGEAVVRVGKSYHKVAFVDGVENVSGFRLEHDGFYQTNVPETIRVVAVDGNGLRAPAVNFVGLVQLSVTEGEGILSPVNLSPENFDNGVAEVKLTVPASVDEPVKVRAHGGALVGESELVVMEPKAIFADIDYNHPHYEAIKYLKDHNIVGGYSDGTFKPNQTVNRVEALKMLMLAFDVTPAEGGNVSFTDTENGAWYVPTLSTAVQRSIVNGYPDGSFKPAQTVNKAEYLKILFRSNDITPTKQVKTSPYADVPINEWFAGYAFMANQMNLLDETNKLYPEQGMTRAAVAETIYRMKMVQEKGLVAYNQ